MKAKVQRWLVDWTDSLRRSLVRSTGGETKVAGWRRVRKEGLESHGKRRAIALAGQRDAAAADRDAKCTRSTAMRASTTPKKSTTMSLLPTVLFNTKHVR